MQLVGVDIGGTFTDLVGYIDGQIVSSKSSTVPSDPTHGVADCLKLADCNIAALGEILHGSTIAINTVLEKKGARTALLTTKGFRDVYAIGRGNRIEAFDIFFHQPKPLVPRSLVFEVPERMLASGEVLVSVDEQAVRQIIKELEASDVEAVAVCLLHSYVNPAHERQVGELLRQLCPQLFVTLSSEVLREYREYERTSTTVLNAFVGPRVRNYLQTLGGFLRSNDFPGKVQIMRSNGGVMSLDMAREQPVSMMESGPVAGMIGAGRLAALLGFRSCIGFDMGGTTAKAGLITDGYPAIESGYVIGDRASGQPMRLPVVDIVEVGAGGGSIAWLDEAGAIHVGPQSAGADPGPAAYGKGSLLPVVTDADLLLGRINPQRFLSGRMALDVAASERAVRKQIADQLQVPTLQAALGIVRIADASMSLAVRAVSLTKGIDPRDTVLIAFGGAGPLHAVSIAREIHIPKVVIPKLPGTFSALGMLMASWRQDFVQTLLGPLKSVFATEAKGVLSELAAAGLDRLEKDGLDPAVADFSYCADLRYVGQEHTISIPLDNSEPGATDLDALYRRFHAEHDRRYRQSAPNELLEVVSLRLVLTAQRSDNLAEEWLSDPWRAEGTIQNARRDVVFGDPERPESAAILWRPSLPSGFAFEGPCVLEEPNATTLLHPGDQAVITEAGHVIITVSGEG